MPSFRVLVPTILVGITLTPTAIAEMTMTLTSFRAGADASSTSMRFTDVGVTGFGVHGSTLAFWGGSNWSSELGGYTSVSLFTGTTTHSFTRADTFASAGTTVYYGWSGRQAMAFNSAGRPVVAFQEQAPRSSRANTFIASQDATTGQLNKTLFANNTQAGHPYSALAVGANGQIAVFASSETMVRDGSGLDRRATDGYLGPLAFGQDGLLHQAIVVDHYSGLARDLVYVSRTADGEWNQQVIDSTAGVGGMMSGHIDMKLDSEGHPVILGNSTGETGFYGLSINELTDSGWQEIDIDLAPIAQELGLARIESGYDKELLFDAEGYAHVALRADEDLIYLLFSSDWTVLNARRFNAAWGFYGMGIDDAGSVWLSYQSRDQGSPTVPAPGAALLVAIGLSLVGWVKRRLA